MKKGDHVSIHANQTFLPVDWRNRELFGTVFYVDVDSTIAVEVEGPLCGHDCYMTSLPETTKNGWWFMCDELKEVKDGTDRTGK